MINPFVNVGTSSLSVVCLSASSTCSVVFWVIWELFTASNFSISTLSNVRFTLLTTIGRRKSFTIYPLKSYFVRLYLPSAIAPSLSPLAPTFADLIYNLCAGINTLSKLITPSILGNAPELSILISPETVPFLNIFWHARKFKNSLGSGRGILRWISSIFILSAISRLPLMARTGVSPCFSSLVM